MIIPGPLTIFDFLYEKAAADGREKALFGNSVVPVRLSAERSQIGDILPSYYLEFPLSGPPCFDLMTVYGGELPPGVRFAPGAGYGYQPVFDWFSTLPAGHGASCAITMDTGRGKPNGPGSIFSSITERIWSPRFWIPWANTAGFPPSPV